MNSSILKNSLDSPLDKTTKALYIYNNYYFIYIFRLCNA
jgi:hypothetical protein